MPFLSRLHAGGTARRHLTLAEAESIILSETTEVSSARSWAAPVVSVRVITFNQASFIRQALDGVLMQTTDFPFEIVVGDDASADGTSEIVLEYQRKYPERIRVLLAKKNLGRITGNARLNFYRTLRACRGKYVALLDGDDYWTSPKKLQTQVDRLERDRDAALCFHWASWLDQSAGTIMPDAYGPPVLKSDYSLDDLLEHHNFLPTSSVVLRSGLVCSLPEWWFNVAVADFPLHILHAQHGTIAFVDETMGVYRYHTGGMHGGLSSSKTCEQALKSFEVPVLQLGLEQRPSSRKGLTTLNLDLVKAYAGERRYLPALTAGLRAARAAPFHELPLVAQTLIGGLPSAKRLAYFASRFARTVRDR